MSAPSVVQSTNESSNIGEIEITTVQPSKKQKKLTSKVWNDFTRITKIVKEIVEGNETHTEVIKAICNHCKGEFDGSSKKGTSHLDNHLKRCPKKKPDIRQQLIQATVTNDDGTTVLANYQFDDSRSQRKLAEAIITHNYPFNIVTHQGFRDYAHSLRPAHRIPCRTSITKMCVDVYQDEKKKLYDLFGNSSFKLSLTMDKWTASSQNLSYLCITAHFIDDDWKLQKRIIGFINMLESTGADICNVFIARMLEWNIDSKLFAVTVDNDKANDVAIRIAKERIGRTLVCNGAFFHVRCAAHIINLVVQDGLKKIVKAIEKVRLSVKYINCSPQMEGSFYEIAKQVDVPSKKCLSLDVCTRWNSTYLMLENALHYRHAFNRFQLKDAKYVHCPSNEDWKHVEILSKCLKHFFDATELLSGSNYPTASLFFEQFCEIHLLLIEWTKSLDDVIVDMAMAMKKKFDKYWNMVNKILAVASFLDPRFKLEAIGFYNNEIYGNLDGMKYTTELINVIKKLYSEYASNGVNRGMESSSSSVSESQVVDSVCIGGRKSRFAQFIKNKENEPSKSDLDHYMEEGVLKWNEKDNKFDILAWWKGNIGKYRTVGRMARDILGIPVSTVASESAFSTGGRVVDPYRSRLTTDMVEALLCTQDWLIAKKTVQGSQSFMNDIFAEDVSSSTLNPTGFCVEEYNYDSDSMEDDL